MYICEVYKNSINLTILYEAVICLNSDVLNMSLQTLILRINLLNIYSVSCSTSGKDRFAFAFAAQFL